MKRSLFAALALVFVLALVAQGCGDDDCIDCPSVTFQPQVSPENVVANLIESYRLRNIEEYSRLLAPEFVFFFQPRVGIESWTRDQDSTGTAALFGTPLVSQIVVQVIHGSQSPPTPPASLRGR